jgi:hypothetical protein
VTDDDLYGEKMNFVELCLRGEIAESEIERFVADWHEGRSGKDLSLHEHLGMTWDEYKQWSITPSQLPAILAAHAT